MPVARRSRPIVAAVQSLESRRLFAAAGQVDPTFGDGGVQATTVESDKVWSSLTQSDGKVLVVGPDRVTRLDRTGNVDAAFGNAGTLQLTYYLRNVALAADDKLVVSGTTDKNSVAVRRYTADGKVDATFDGDGLATFTLDNRNTSGRVYGSEAGGSVIVDSAGRIVLSASGGFDTDADGTNDAYDDFVVRLTSTGQLDASFSGDGVAVTSAASDASGVGYGPITQAADGSYVLAGMAGRYPFPSSINALRVTASGAIAESATIGSGSLYLAFTNRVSIDAQPNGGIVIGVTQFESNPAYLIRLKPDLTLDNGFAKGGIYELPAASLEGFEIQPDNKIVFGGFRYETLPFPANYGFRLNVGRLTAGGALDGTFGTGGLTATNLTAFNNGNAAPDSSAGLSLLPDGRVIAVGPQRYSTTAGLVRLTADAATAAGQPDTTFGGDGLVETDFTYYPFSSPKYSQVVQSDGKTILVSRDRATRYLADGRLDTAYGSGGSIDLSAYTGVYGSVAGAALTADDRLVVTQNDTNNRSRFFVRRFLKNGTPDASFDGDGAVVLSLQNAADPALAYDYQQVFGPEVDASGRIVASVFAQHSGTDSTAAFSDSLKIRLTASGQLDASFSGDGIVVTREGRAGSSPTPATGPATATGPYVLAGARSRSNGSGDDLQIRQLSESGALVANVLVPLGSHGAGNSYVADYVKQPDGKIVFALARRIDESTPFPLPPGNPFLVRVNANLTLDSSFGSGGFIELSNDAFNSDVHLAQQPDGKLLVADYETIPYTAGPNWRMYVRRYTSTGVLDATFGDGGVVRTPIITRDDTYGSPEWFGGLTLLADGRVQAFGPLYPGGGAPAPLGILRLTGDVSSSAPTKLAGTGYGSPGSFQNAGMTFDKALDGSLSTYFDAPTGNGNFVALDLGAKYKITSIAYASRGGWASRMNGGVFQASNTRDFSSGVVTLYTVGASENPSSTSLTTRAVNADGYRYVRYLSPNGSYGNVSEIQFFGTPSGTTTPPTTPTKLTGTVVGTSGSFAGSGNTIDKAFDGSLSTYFDGPTGNGNVLGLDLGANYNLTSIAYASRAGWSGRMNGGVFQASTSASFTAGTTVTLYTIGASENPPSDSLTTRSVSANGYRYVRYVAPAGSYGNVSEIQFFGTPTSTTPPPTTPTKLAGTVVGTSGSFANAGNTIAKAFDNDLATFFDGPSANGNVLGLDLGANYDLTSIAYAARGGWSGRMNGGVFQASTSSSFAAGSTVTLYTVGASENPPSGTLTTRTVNAKGYRYVRYVAPDGSYGNVAELQFFGTPSSTTTPSTPTQLAGTTIGTPGSFGGFGNTIAKATDGRIDTFFDAPTANGNWVGLDLGSVRSIAQVKFAPRAGYADRMTGGKVQISTTADFSSGVTNLFTLTYAPTPGELNTRTFATPVNARYIRYISPDGSYGNIAEFQVFG